MFINHREFDHEYDDVGQVDEVDNDDESDDVFLCENDATCIELNHGDDDENVTVCILSLEDANLLQE